MLGAVTANAADGRMSAVASTATEASRRVRMSDPRGEEDEEGERGSGEADAAARGEGRADAEDGRGCREGDGRDRQGGSATAGGGVRRGGLREFAGRGGADRVSDRDGERVDGVGAPLRRELGAQDRLGVRLRGGQQLDLVAVTLRRELAGLRLCLRLA